MGRLRILAKSAQVADQKTVALRIETFTPGDFSGLGKVIIDPLTGAPFPGNVIPSNRIDHFARAYTQLYPEPNFEDARGSHQWTERIRVGL